MDITIACPCPGTPHESDEVKLRERLDFHSSLSIRQQLGLLYLEYGGDKPPLGEVLATLSEGYLRYGIESWTLVDEDAKPLPVSSGTVRDFMEQHPQQAIVVSDAADNVYAPIILPLVLKVANSSAPGPTETPTSPPTTPTSSRENLKPSSPSSTTSTPTDATVTISSSPAGVLS
jgi:hypothetical protein